MKRRAVLVVLILAAAFVGLAKEVPYLGSRVNDLAFLLEQSTEQRLEKSLEQLEKDTGAQLVVLTVKSLEGDVLEEFSLRVAETWQLGRKDHDDGVLILIAEEERKIRIEVGYGLEGAIPDVTAKRVIDGIMTPNFRAGDFDSGVIEASDALAGLIRGEAVDLPEAGDDFDTLGEKIAAGSIFMAVVGVFSFIAIFGKGGGGWFLYFFLMPFYAAFPFAIFGRYGLIVFAAWVIGFPILRIMTWHTGWGANFRDAHPGLTKFATSTSSGGGGGFSGGGGSFGGGGASGGW